MIIFKFTLTQVEDQRPYSFIDRFQVQEIWTNDMNKEMKPDPYQTHSQPAIIEILVAK